MACQTHFKTPEVLVGFLLLCPVIVVYIIYKYLFCWAQQHKPWVRSLHQSYLEKQILVSSKPQKPPIPHLQKEEKNICCKF